MHPILAAEWVTNRCYNSVSTFDTSFDNEHCTSRELPEKQFNSCYLTLLFIHLSNTVTLFTKCHF